MASLYESVSGVSIVARLVTPSESKLKEDASVFVKTGKWLAGQITRQEEERGQQSIESLRQSISAADAILSNADQARDSGAEQSRQRFLNKGLQDFQKANQQFHMASMGVEGAAGGGRSQRATMEKRLPGGKDFEALEETGKGYTRFYNELLKKEGELAFKLQKGVKDNMTGYEKLKIIARNYYDMEGKEREEVNLSIKQTVANITELQNKERAKAAEALKHFEKDSKDAAEIKANMAQKIGLLEVQKNTVKSLGDMLAAASAAEKQGIKGVDVALEAVDEQRQKDIQLQKEQEQRAKALNQANMTMARNLASNVTAAFRNYRGILMQTTMTLSVMYWRTQRLTQAFMDFDKELINAQSIWQTTDEQLYQISNEVIKFGTQYGIQYGNASEVLYQFASAGLTAAQSQVVLNDTLKLAMATQGDANTLGKLLVQVIAGFGLEMEVATELTDKFAHAINKSLIEWQDLASSVKFAMPFFVAAGQSVDQLLGALQILTNRALEAGIAGRGLRQALAEFTQHAEDNQASFRKLGVEILDTDGSMRDLTDIATQFNRAIGEGATDMDVMITLMEDLNIRGATAFVHLAQSADEFTAAVADLENSAGAASEMAEIQQKSLVNQIQILKNAITAPFLLADPMYVQEGYMNAFHKALVLVVEQVQELFYVTLPGGQVMLSETGFVIKDFVIRFVERLGDLIVRVGEIFTAFTEQGYANIDMLKLYFLPLTMLIYVIESFPPSIGKVIFAYYLLNKALALNQIVFGIWGAVTTGTILGVQFTWAEASLNMIFWGETFQVTLWGIAQTMAAIAGSMLLLTFAAFATYKIIEPMNTLAKVLLAVAAAYIIYWAAMSGPAAIGTVAAMAVGMAAAGVLIGSIASMVAPHVTLPDYGTTEMPEFAADYEAYQASFEGYAGPEAFNAQGNQTTMVVDTLEVTGEANMDAAQAFYNATLVTE